MVCYHYTVRERPLEVEITDSTCFVLACDTARCTERETSNAADRKSCRGTERHSHSFPLNNIIAYLSQIIVNVHNDFTLGYKLCIVHFSAKRLSFCGSNTVCMLHIESCNTDCAFSFRLLCFFKLWTSSSFVPYSSFLKQTYVRLICLLNKQFRPLLELNVTGLVCVKHVTSPRRSAVPLHSVSLAYLFIFWLDNHAVF